MGSMSMNISLSEELSSFVVASAHEAGFSSSSEYVQDLLQREQERAKAARFRRLIQEGLDSGHGRPWEEHKAELLARIESARQAAAQSKP